MLIEGPGTFRLKRTHDSEILFASVSAPEFCRVEVFRNNKLIDKVYVGSGNTHSWWNTNPLFVTSWTDGEEILIEMAGVGAMRIEGQGIELVESTST